MALAPPTPTSRYSILSTRKPQTQPHPPHTLSQTLFRQPPKPPSKWRTNAESSSTCTRLPKSMDLVRERLTNIISSSYVPRKCSATNRIIKAKDHASVQLSVAKVDENGRATGENQVYALCGFVRAMGESDDAMNRLTQKDGFLKNVWSASR